MMLMGAYEWLALGFLGFVILLAALRIGFRRMRRDLQKTDLSTYDWQLNDLRRLVEKGQMSEDEYQRARDVILSRNDAKYEPVKGFPVLAPQDQPRTPPDPQ